MEEEVKSVDWEEIVSSNTFWNPAKEGDELVGVVKSVEQGDFGTYLIILDKDNKEWRTPAHRVLQDKLKDIKASDVIRILFVKRELPKVKNRSDTMIYKVFKAKK